MSPVQTGGQGCIVALLQESLALQPSSIFVDLEGELVVLDVTYNSKVFKLIRIYARKLQSNFYRHLEKFLVTFKITKKHTCFLDCLGDATPFILFNGRPTSE